jgi:hypothetical protein
VIVNVNVSMAANLKVEFVHNAHFCSELGTLGAFQQIECVHSSPCKNASRHVLKVKMNKNSCLRQ